MLINKKTSFSLLLLFPLVLFFMRIAHAQATDIGTQLYVGNCAKCHGREGEGFLKLYPPIHDSRFLKEDVSSLPCIIRNGLKGEIIVGDTTFNQIMPPMKQVTPEQMTAIIGFMQQKWEHPITELRVNQWVKECKKF